MIYHPSGGKRALINYMQSVTHVGIELPDLSWNFTPPLILVESKTSWLRHWFPSQTKDLVTFDSVGDDALE